MSSVLWLVRQGRRQAEALMLDTCRIRAVTGNATDPGSGVVTPSYGPVLYQGKAKLQSQQPFPSNPDAGEHQWTTTPLYLHLPVTVPAAAVAPGVFVDVLSSVDAVNVGRGFRVRSGDRKTLQTAVRVLVEEVS
ncbi:DUF6093 family protein [Amycolatopsis thailandensis]|uniref:DUF6093 family protein n=1 Tax=Amycolatopsis thailandensis TaxID=589330 RepID=UPI00379B8B5A